MRAFGEELCELFGRQRNRIRPRDADRVKALRARGTGEGFFQRQRIGQKSRSA
jgi:hypothetical protein